MTRDQLQLVRHLFVLLSENRLSAARLFRGLALRDHNSDRRALFFSLEEGAKRRAAAYERRSHTLTPRPSSIRAMRERLIIIRGSRAMLGAIEALERDDVRLHILLIAVVDRRPAEVKTQPFVRKLRLVR